MLSFQSLTIVLVVMVTISKGSAIHFKACIESNDCLVNECCLKPAGFEGVCLKKLLKHNECIPRWLPWLPTMKNDSKLNLLAYCGCGKDLYCLPTPNLWKELYTCQHISSEPRENGERRKKLTTAR